MQRNLIKIRLTVSLGILSALTALLVFSNAAFAQAPVATPAPTPAPSGSNPTQLAPTDVAPDFALLCALGFFAFLLIWLVVANFYTRAKVFEDPNKEPGY